MKKLLQAFGIVIMIIVIIIIAIIIFLNVKYLIQQKRIKYVESIKYDIKIKYTQTLDESNGWSGDIYYDLIDTTNKRVYLIYDYDIIGEAPKGFKGHNYKINEKDLTDSDINTIIELYNSMENKNPYSFFSDSRSDCVISIEYNGETRSKIIKYDEIGNYIPYKDRIIK